MILGKGRFLAGLQCHRLLWWRAHEPRAPELERTAEIEATFEETARVETFARRFLPEGRTVAGDVLEDRLADTRAALDQGAGVIFGAAFQVAELAATADVLDRRQAAVSLIEVKASTRVKSEHLSDVAFQAHVLERAGLPPRRIRVLHLNRDHAHPGPEPLFVDEDVTEAIEERRAWVAERIEAQRAVLAGALPPIPIGRHCFTPRTCPFLARCWPDDPHHVVTLHGMRERAAELMALGYATIRDLPESFPLEAVAARQRRAVVSDALVVEPGLKAALDRLRPPVAFLDFETVGPAIPRWEGCHPWEPIPVQFSCHVESGEGYVHHEWLAEGPGDPREALTERLIEACRGAGTILAWYAPFELDRLRHLAAVTPRLAAPIEDLCGRVADLWEMVRDHVWHPDFQGSLSLKRVLPVLAPDFHYRDLEVSGGGQAMRALSRLLFDSPDAAERARLRAGLFQYCALDTWGMVQLLRRLREMAAGLPV